MGAFAGAAAYFPLKIYWLTHYQTRFWIRIAVSGLFWCVLLTMLAVSERSGKSKTT
jgi:hypothetical protein